MTCGVTEMPGYQTPMALSVPSESLNTATQRSDERRPDRSGARGDAGENERDEEHCDAAREESARTPRAAVHAAQHYSQLVRSTSRFLRSVTCSARAVISTVAIRAQAPLGIDSETGFAIPART